MDRADTFSAARTARPPDRSRWPVRNAWRSIFTCSAKLFFGRRQLTANQRRLADTVKVPFSLGEFPSFCRPVSL